MNNTASRWLDLAQREGRLLRRMHLNAWRVQEAERLIDIREPRFDIPKVKAWSDRLFERALAIHRLLYLEIHGREDFGELWREDVSEDEHAEVLVTLFELAPEAVDQLAAGLVAPQYLERWDAYDNRVHGRLSGWHDDGRETAFVRIDRLFMRVAHYEWQMVIGSGWDEETRAFNKRARSRICELVMTETEVTCPECIDITCQERYKCFCADREARERFIYAR